MAGQYIFLRADLASKLIVCIKLYQQKQQDIQTLSGAPTLF